MNTELLNEFYLLQQSRAAKYNDLLDNRVYIPIKSFNTRMSNWVTKRGRMLLSLDKRFYKEMQRLKVKYLKFPK